MGKRILIAGGAGFVGSRLADELLGRRHRVRRVSRMERVAPKVTGPCRMGDIRHCFAGITHARRVLGYEPWMSFDAGLVELHARGLAV